MTRTIIVIYYAVQYYFYRTTEIQTKAQHFNISYSLRLANIWMVGYQGQGKISA